MMTLLEKPMHPCAVLKELYIEPTGMTAITLARQVGVPRTRVERLIKGTTGITADTALRLARAFGTSPTYWINVQTNHDMAIAGKQVDVSSIEPVA